MFEMLSEMTPIACDVEFIAEMPENIEPVRLIPFLL